MSYSAQSEIGAFRQSSQQILISRPTHGIDTTIALRGPLLQKQKRIAQRLISSPDTIFPTVPSTTINSKRTIPNNDNKKTHMLLKPDSGRNSDAALTDCGRELVGRSAARQNDACPHRRCGSLHVHVSVQYFGPFLPSLSIIRHEIVHYFIIRISFDEQPFISMVIMAVIIIIPYCDLRSPPLPSLTCFHRNDFDWSDAFVILLRCDMFYEYSGIIGTRWRSFVWVWKCT